MFVRLLVFAVLAAGPAVAQTAATPAKTADAAPAAVQKVSTAPASAAPAALTPQQRLEAGRKRTLEFAAAGQCDEAKEMAMRIGEAALTAQVEKACAR